jgi:hypothetical protein
LADFYVVRIVGGDPDLDRSAHGAVCCGVARGTIVGGSMMRELFATLFFVLCGVGTSKALDMNVKLDTGEKLA